jgi:lysophospholipase L1-like esterase
VTTLLIAMGLAVILDARGIVHSGNGMQDGPKRSATLAVGNFALKIATFTHLTWPWDEVQTALGRQHQPAIAPLLASDPLPAVVPTSPVQVRPKVTHAMAHYPVPTVRLIGTHRKPRLLKPVVAAVPWVRPTHKPTPKFPLRILVAGDSLVGYLGPELIDEVARVTPTRGFVDSHNGTGLTRPDFVDWSIVARQEMSSDNPDATVVMIGGNDFQNMTLPTGKFFLAGTPAWTREYERRAVICMQVWARDGNRRIYWLSVPPARDAGWARDDAQINVALRRAAALVPGAEYVDVLGPVTDHGRYADFVKVNSQETLIREPDGVHLNIMGSTLVAEEMRAILAREWHLEWRHAG